MYISQCFWQIDPDMKTTSDYLEEVIEEIGGFGKFQVFLHGSILLSKVSITWSLLIMAFAGAAPDWWCVYPNTTYTTASGAINYNTTVLPSSSPNVTVPEMTKSFQTCTPPSNESSVCQSFVFDDSMRTIINEVNVWFIIEINALTAACL